MPNAKIVMAFMDTWGAKAKLAATIAVGEMAHEARKHCEDMISARDHSLADLRKMGHPYAAAHPANPHEPPETVHVQSGKLISGLQDGDVAATAKGAQARVWNDETQLDEWVQTGTQSMIARPYMARVRQDFADEIIAAGTDAMKQRLKAS